MVCYVKKGAVFLKTLISATIICLLAMLSACEDTKQMEIKEADMSDLEKTEWMLQPHKHLLPRLQISAIAFLEPKCI